jgi:Uma2 family endonuclease
MAGAAGRAHYTYDEYRRFEDSTDAKHEYVDGQILAMAGGTPEHAALAAAAIAELSRQLAGGPCTTFSSDLRVRILATGLATYPDATVICGALERDPEDANAALNPTVVVEVLSDSTAAYDAGEKFEHYRQIPHLREYVLVSHLERRVELRSRRPDGGWESTELGRGHIVRLASIAVDLGVDTLYDRSGLTRSL